MSHFRAQTRHTFARERGFDGSNSGSLMFCIEAMNGPLDGKRWTFGESIVIGRDRESAQAVLSTDRSVSRRHASVRAENGTLLLTDLESRNGTLVADKPIEAAVNIEPGEPFLVGRTLLRVLKI